MKAIDVKPANGVLATEIDRLLDGIRKPGICSTCDHASSCLFLRASRKPVWFCDEFEDRGASAAENNSPIVSSAPDNEQSYSEALQVGLCANCEARQGCAHRQSGQPVWECEEYR